jgi:cytochrome P450
MYTGMTCQHQLLPDRRRLTVHGQEVAVATGFAFDRYSAGNAADPYPLFRRLREEQPVHFAAEFGVWVVSRYDDVRRVLMDPTRFSSAFRLRSPDVPAPGVADVLAGGYPEVAALVNEDPPAHRHTRDLVVRAFTARRIAALEPYVAEVAGELLDAMEPRGEADLVAELAGPLPLRVICELIGLPAWDAPRVLEWTRQLSALAAAGASADEQQTAAYESVAFERYLAAEILDRRVRPRDDLLTELTRVQSEGEGLSDRQLVSLLISLVVAGHGTTADLVAGALVQLLHRPELWAAVGDDPQLLAAVVEETLRFDPPVQGMFRRAVFDVHIAGVAIPAGAELFVLAAGASRDYAVFEKADEFVPGRPDGDRHLAFGRGIHYCLGASLARMEAQTALRLVRQRLPRLRITPGVEIPYLPDLVHRGPHRLPATWT